MKFPPNIHSSEVLFDLPENLSQAREVIYEAAKETYIVDFNSRLLYKLNKLSNNISTTLVKRSIKELSLIDLFCVGGITSCKKFLFII